MQTRMAVVLAVLAQGVAVSAAMSCSSPDDASPHNVDSDSGARVGDVTPVDAAAPVDGGAEAAASVYGLDGRPANATCVPPDLDAGGPAALLSQTGCFESSDPKVPAKGLIPYDVNAPFFSDNATKRRWMALPDGAKIHVEDDGDFTFPNGTVLVKEFSLAGRRIETRLFTRGADGTWAGFTYQWNADETDATLVDAAGAVVDVETDAGVDAGTDLPATWSFPSRAQCLRCHTKAARDALGPEIAQLERDFTYEATGRSANELDTLAYIGMFDAPLAPAPRPRLPSLDEVAQPLQDRARAYLHSNCSGCHRPTGGGPTADFRFGTPFAAQNVCDVAPVIGGAPADSKLIVPGNAASSVVSIRMHNLPGDTPNRMPPLGRTLVHTAATAVVDQWIDGLTSCPAQ